VSTVRRLIVPPGDVRQSGKFPLTSLPRRRRPISTLTHASENVLPIKKTRSSDSLRPRNKKHCTRLGTRQSCKTLADTPSLGASLLGRRHHFRFWTTTGVSCPTALGALCGQLTFRLAYVVPPTLSSYGDRTFAAAGPRLWNSLPVQLRNPDITYGLFRRRLKGHLFREALTRRSNK